MDSDIKEVVDETRLNSAGEPVTNTVLEVQNSTIGVTSKTIKEGDKKNG